MALNTTPATFTTSEVVTATKLNTEVRDALIGIQAAWTSYTPTWAGSSFTLGNGTPTGFYTRFGKTVAFLASLTAGSTTSFGTSLTVTLPVSHAHNGLNVTVSVGAIDASSSNRYLLVAELASSGAIIRSVGASGLLASITSTSPITWASGDIITAAGVYEAS